jgi:cytochrome c oxidase assembly protein Cox11
LFIAAGAIIMLGLSYISVPLYQLFCQTYGIGGTVQKINYEQSIQNKIETLQNVHKGPQEVPKDTQNIQTSELNINYVRKINKLDKLDRDGALTEKFLKFY